MQALYLPGEGAYIRYLDLPGAEPARAVLHCLGGAGSLYLQTFQQPALSHRRTILIDLLGFGFSDRPAQFSYRLADHARVVAILLEHLGLRGCDLVGHSLGGHIATALASGRPDLVARLVLAEAPLIFGAASVSRTIAAQSEAAFRECGYSSFIADLCADVAGDHATAIFAGACAVAAPHALYRTAADQIEAAPAMIECLHELPLPRVYLAGEQTMRDPEQARLIGDLAMHGIVTRIVPDAAHHLNLDNSAGFAAALADCFAG